MTTELVCNEIRNAHDATRLRFEVSTHDCYDKEGAWEADGRDPTGRSPRWVKHLVEEPAKRRKDALRYRNAIRARVAAGLPREGDPAKISSSGGQPA